MDNDNYYGDHNYADDESGDFTENLDGFQIEDGSEPAEMSAEELLAEFGGGDTLSAIQGHREEHTSLNEGYRGMTAADLQLRRLQGDQASDITGYSMGTRMAIKDLTSDSFRGMNTYGVESIAEIDAMRSRASTALELSSNDFSNMMRVDASLAAGKVTDRNGRTIREAQNYGASEVAQAIKFVEGIGLNLDVGPGGRQKLDAGSVTAEAYEKKNEEMAWAMSTMQNIAGKFIHADTKASGIAEDRLDRTTHELINRALDGSQYKMPKVGGGSFTYDEKKKLPSPLDLNVPGLIDNLSVGGKVNGEFVGGSEFTTRGYQEAILKGTHSEEYLAVAAPFPMRSLFPKPKGIKYNSPEDAEYKAQRAIGYRALESDYAKASAILNSQMTTNQNEDTGNSTRWSGYAQDEEQLKRNALYEDAAMYDIDIVGRSVSGASADLLAKVGKGSDKTGMFGGGEDVSDRDEYVREHMEDKPFVGPMPATQGSDAWLGQREGNITASVAGTLFEEDGVEKAAINMANARLGNTPEFLSSGHVAEGSKYEDKVLAAFLNSKDGQGFEMKEAFFETNKKYPGFGVSPDASLYNEAGDRYLVEAKFLASDQTMAKSKKTYGVQVQEQLMVTGAKGVYFSRMNKRTGRLETELIRPDKEVQAEILKRGNEALALSETLDAEGVSDMTKRLSRPARQEAVDAGPATVMQTEAKAKHAKATVMDLSKAAKNPLASAISSTTVSDPTGSTDISTKEFGDRLQREENIVELSNNATALGADKVLQDAQDAKDHKKNFAGPLQGSSTGYNRFDRTDGEGGAGVTRLAKAEMEAYAEVTKSAADATKESSRSIKKLGASALKAAGVVTELVNLYAKGNETQMSDIQLAAKIGGEVNNVRGMKFALEDGGVAEKDLNSIVATAGSISQELSQKDGAGSFTTRLAEFTGKSTNAGILGLPKKDYNELVGKTPQQVLSMALDDSKGLDAAGRRDLLGFYGLGDMAVAVDDTTGQDMVDATANINEKERKATNKGLAKVRQTKQELIESTSTGVLGGENTATIVGGLGVVASVATSATALVLAKTKAGQAAVQGTVSAIKSSASRVAPHLARAGTAIVGASIAVPATALTGVLASTAIYADAMENDPESVMGKLAIAKSKKGPEMPGILGNSGGTALAESIMDWWSEDSDIVPSTGLGNASTSNKAASTLNSNVVVNVEVSSDLSVATEVNDNGSIYSDLDTSNSQD